MITFSTTEVAASIATISSLSLEKSTAYCDHIYAKQPHIFLSALALSSNEVTPCKLEALLYILMVVHQAVETRITAPMRIVTRDEIQCALQNRIAMVDLLAMDTDPKLWAATIAAHSQPVLLAFVGNTFIERHLVSDSEADFKVMTMALVVLDVYSSLLK